MRDRNPPYFYDTKLSTSLVPNRICVAVTVSDHDVYTDKEWPDRTWSVSKAAPVDRERIKETKCLFRRPDTNDPLVLRGRKGIASHANWKTRRACL